MVCDEIRRQPQDWSKPIGENGPTIPRGFYKIVLDYDGSYKKGIAFMFKNKDIDQPLEKFVTTIDLVEEYTGIDFFPELTKEEEQALEELLENYNYSRHGLTAKVIEQFMVNIL